MRKIKIILLMVLFMIVSLILVGCSKTVKVEKSFPDIVNDLESYILEAKLETYFPSGTRECQVLVYYKGTNKIRVELSNPNVLEKQIMIKNKDGVYILIPSINKTFKITSNWPNNSSQPYLLHSLSHDIISDENIVKNNNGNETTLELKTKLFENVPETKQIITFNNKSKMPTNVAVYDSGGKLISQLIINKINTNIDINDEMFIVNDSLSTLRTIYTETPMEFDRNITYPTYCPEGTSLDQEVIQGSTIDKKVIMKYNGTTSFTIVEEFINETETPTTEYYNGYIYVMAGTFAITNETSVKFYDHGLEYLLASNVTSLEDLVLIAESLRPDLTK